MLFLQSTQMGKNITQKTPMEFVTDGLPAYNKTFRKEFGGHRKPIPKHTREIHLDNQVANNNSRMSKCRIWRP